jgi:hypothetical protein
MEIKRGGWIRIIPSEGVKPDLVGRMGVIQQVLKVGEKTVLFVYVWGYGNVQLFENQVKPILGEGGGNE